MIGEVISPWTENRNCGVFAGNWYSGLSVSLWHQGQTCVGKRNGYEKKESGPSQEVCISIGRQEEILDGFQARGLCELSPALRKWCLQNQKWETNGKAIAVFEHICWSLKLSMFLECSLMLPCLFFFKEKIEGLFVLIVQFSTSIL